MSSITETWKWPGRSCPGFIPHLSIIDYLFSEGIGEIEGLMKRYEALVARAAGG